MITKAESQNITEKIAIHDIDTFVVETLRAGKQFVLAELPAALDYFYEHAGKFEIMRSFFRDRQHMAAAKQAQINHWSLILEAQFNEQYLASTSKIGETHHRINLPPGIYIGGYNVLISKLVDAVQSRFPVNALSSTSIGAKLKKQKIDGKKALSSAIFKAGMLDMDIAISVYEAAANKERQHVITQANEFESVMTKVVENVVRTSKDLEESASSMIGMAGQASSQSSEISAAAHQTSANVNTVAAATEQLSASVVEINRQVLTSASVAEEAVSNVNKTSARVDELSKASETIGSIVDVINAIARQTNLLALNATIEAARAGEAGNGFSVVANEVKSLAAQTSKATSDIENQIRGIQDITSNTLASIEQISSVISSIHTSASAIAAAVEQQGAATAEISRNVLEAAQGTGQVSDRIQELSGLAGSTETSAKSVMGVADELGKEASGLQDVTNRFLQSLRQRRTA